MPEEQEHGLEIAMGRMLQIGVTIAALVVLAGGILYLKQSGGAQPDYHHFHAAERLDTMSEIFSEAAHLDPRGIIELGMLLLIATPVGRVLFGVAGFAVLRDRLYVAVSAVVLAVLLFSFFWQR